MGIEVIIDDSLEGLELTRELQYKIIQNKLNNDFIIRWGNWLDKKEMKVGIEFNSSQAIKNTIDKENILLILKKVV